MKVLKLTNNYRKKCGFFSNAVSNQKCVCFFFLQDALKEVERLKMELSTLPEHVVVETTEHKCLQSQFSVLYNEAMQLKTQLDESRGQLQVNLHA